MVPLPLYFFTLLVALFISFAYVTLTLNISNNTICYFALLFLLLSPHLSALYLNYIYLSIYLPFLSFFLIYLRFLFSLNPTWKIQKNSAASCFAFRFCIKKFLKKQTPFANRSCPLCLPCHKVIFFTCAIPLLLHVLGKWIFVLFCFFFCFWKVDVFWDETFYELLINWRLFM